MLRYIFNTVSRYMLDFKYIIFYIYLLATLNSFVTMSSHLPKVSDVQVEHFTFPASVKPPGSCHHSLFLGGAGVRGLEIQGKFVKFTAIGVYLEDDAVKTLAAKWQGKTAEELNESVPFFRDIVTGPFEKFTQVTLILPLTGQQYSEKVAENCVAIWKAMGLYTDAEAKAIEKFLDVFKNETFAPGASILFTQSPKGSLTITFSKDMTVPEAGKAVIDNKLLSEAVLESIIGKHGVSPSVKESIAARLSVLLKGGKDTNGETHECKKPEAEKTAATTKECKKAEGDKLNGETEIVV